MVHVVKQRFQLRDFPAHLAHGGNSTADGHTRLEVIDYVCDESDEHEEDQNDEEDDDVTLHVEGSLLCLLG